jgi:hypothetical protein
VALIDDLVSKYARADLKSILAKVGLESIPDSAHDRLRTVTLAQWLLESQDGTSTIATTANNFAGLAWRKEMAGFATPISINIPPENIPIEFCQFRDLDAFIIGYWKFLTRSVYAGLAANTDSPDRFIGFIQRQGFSSSPTYISRVLALMPEAKSRLAKGKGESEAGPTLTFQIVSFPQTVAVGEEFIVAGNAPVGEVGQPLKVLWDGKYAAADGVVGRDCRWRLSLKLAQPGDRRLRVTLGTQSKEVTITAKALPDKDKEAPNPVGAIALNLTGSVGTGGKNQAAEVIAVKKRLVQLGFNWLGDPNSASANTGFIYAIRLFQSIVAGKSNLSGDGRIDVGGLTHRWLQASNAPQWLTMPDSDPQINFVNYEKAQTNDDHDFGTSWLRDVVLQIAKTYHDKTVPTRLPSRLTMSAVPKVAIPPTIPVTRRA